MNFSAILIRFILLVTVISTWVACQQEPELDSPEVDSSSSTSTSEPTQPSPTATPLASPQPNSTVESASDYVLEPTAAPVATVLTVDERLSIRFELPENWLIEERGDESCTSGSCPEVFLSMPHTDGTATNLTISAVAPQDLATLDKEMNQPDYEHRMVNSLPGRSHLGENKFDILLFVGPGEALRIAGQWLDNQDDLIPLVKILNSIEATKLVNTPDDLDENVHFSAIPLAGYGTSRISFQHPRLWQTSLVEDSGYFVWLVSNVDPNEEFWNAMSTGEELVFMIIPDLKSTEIEELTSNDWPKHFNDNVESAYGISETEVSGYAIRDSKAFGFSGYFPAEKKGEFELGIETIITSFGWKEINDNDLRENSLLAVRREGELPPRTVAYGYVPLAAVSLWTFNGEQGQEINFSAGTFDPHVTLLLDIQDENGVSILGEEPAFFSGSTTIGVEIPATGKYYLALSSPTGYIKLWPYNPPADNKIFGWYGIILK